MKQIIIPIIFISLFASAGKAQSYEGTVDYQKKDEKAIIIEFPYPPSVVEDAIIDKLEKLGFKKKESKGFLVYKNIVLSPADFTAILNIYRKSLVWTLH